MCFSWVCYATKGLLVLSLLNSSKVIMMDVIFHEDLVYFLSEPKLHREHHREIQTQEYERRHIFEDDTSTLNKQDMCILDEDGITSNNQRG